MKVANHKMSVNYDNGWLPVIARNRADLLKLAEYS